MSSSGTNAGMETHVPLNGIVNNALLHFSRNINWMLLQIGHILHFCLVDSLLHYALDFVVNCTEVEAVGRPQIWADECSSLALKEVDRLARPVLKD